MKLDIPFISQTSNTIRNDCGAACVAACVGIQLDAVLQVMDMPPHSYFSVHHILTGLRHFGLYGRYVRPITIPQIHHSLSQRQPVICLIHYGMLPADLRVGSFRGAHWVLVAGREETDFFVHDPLHPTTGHQRWPAAALELALGSRNTSNLPWQAVVVAKEYPLLNENAEAHKALVAMVRQSVHQLRDELAIKDAYLMQLYEALGVPTDNPDAAQGLALSAILRQKGGR